MNSNSWKTLGPAVLIGIVLCICSAVASADDIAAVKILVAPDQASTPINESLVVIQPALIADAHVHHGFEYGQDKLELTSFDYFANRGIRTIGFPLPIRRDRTNNLAASIKTEIKDLNDLSQHDGKFRIRYAGTRLDDSSASNSLNVFLCVEYFHGVFGGNPRTVDEYRVMGISSITLIDNEIDPFFNGDLLTSFGKQVIRRMNEAGIRVDIAHLTEKQSIEVIRFSTSPVISSHSAAMSVSGSDNGISDKVLDELKENGGYVFTTFNKNDLMKSGESVDNGIDRYIDHVVHLTVRLGEGHVGIGTDYQAMGRYVANGLNEPEVFRSIQKGLIAAGFSDRQIRMLSAGAFLSAMGIDH